MNAGYTIKYKHMFPYRILNIH